MANVEQLAILKQGVEVWNKWKKENFRVEVDLNRAKLTGAHLVQADLRRAKLRGTDLVGAMLGEANLRLADLKLAKLWQADLSAADLRGAIFSEADLGAVNLRDADLSEADLTLANLDKANLSQTNLSGANLGITTLRDTNLSGANLRAADLSQARIGGTIFGNSDLSQTIGLEYTVHYGPSSISTDTFILSKGKIPEVFLRGCGLSDWEIEVVKIYNPEINNEQRSETLNKIYNLTAQQALQISSLFISYSHDDGPFVDRLESKLNEKGIRFWRDIHDMKAGRIETQIDRAIGQNRTVLLLLSENSLDSDWVEHEVRTARVLEKEMGRDVLCPVALDDSWKDSHWPKRVMEQIMEYNILDFSAWEDDSKFDAMFQKLIDGLELFYKR